MSSITSPSEAVGLTDNHAWHRKAVLNTVGGKGRKGGDVACENQPSVLGGPLKDRGIIDTCEPGFVNINDVQRRRPSPQSPDDAAVHVFIHEQL